MRKADIKRETAETKIDLSLDLDGNIDESLISTGVGFLDHMLVLFARYAGLELKLTCVGDTYVDDHHSVEDVGITLGMSLREALCDGGYAALVKLISRWMKVLCLLPLIYQAGEAFILIYIF